MPLRPSSTLAVLQLLQNTYEHWSKMSALQMPRPHSIICPEMLSVYIRPVLHWHLRTRRETVAGWFAAPLHIICEHLWPRRLCLLFLWCAGDILWCVVCNFTLSRGEEKVTADGNKGKSVLYVTKRTFRVLWIIRGGKRTVKAALWQGGGAILKDI